MGDMFGMRGPGMPQHIRQPHPQHEQFGPRGPVPHSDQGPTPEQRAQLAQIIQERRQQQAASQGAMNQPPTAPAAATGPNPTDLDPFGDLPLNPFDPSQPEGSSGHILPDLKAGVSSKAPEAKVGGRTHKQSTSEDEKPDTEDETIADLLGMFVCLFVSNFALIFSFNDGLYILDFLFDEVE